MRPKTYWGMGSIYRTLIGIDAGPVPFVGSLVIQVIAVTDTVLIDRLFDRL